MASTPHPSSVIFATASHDRIIRTWHLTAGTTICNIHDFKESQVNCLALSIKGTSGYLAAGGNRVLRLFDAATGRPFGAREVSSSHNVTAVGFQKDARWIYTASEDGTARIWDLRSPQASRIFECKAAVTDCVVHPTSESAELVTADQNGIVRVWSADTQKCIQSVAPGRGSPMRSVSISPDGETISCVNNDGNAFVGAFLNGRNPADLQLNGAHVIERLGVGLPRLVFTKVFAAHPRAYALRCTLSRCGRLLATTGSDAAVQVWQLPSAREQIDSMVAAQSPQGVAGGAGLGLDERPPLLNRLIGHQRWVWDCAFNADGRYLVTCSSDATARLWDRQSGVSLVTYGAPHTKPVTCLALHDG